MKKEFDRHKNLTLDKIIDPAKVLYAAVGNVKSVLVIGVTTDGGLYLASSQPYDETLALAFRAIDDLKARAE